MCALATLAAVPRRVVTRNLRGFARRFKTHGGRRQLGMKAPARRRLLSRHKRRCQIYHEEKHGPQDVAAFASCMCGAILPSPLHLGRAYPGISRGESAEEAGESGLWCVGAHACPPRALHPLHAWMRSGEVDEI